MSLATSSRPPEKGREAEISHNPKKCPKTAAKWGEHAQRSSFVGEKLHYSRPRDLNDLFNNFSHNFNFEVINGKGREGREGYLRSRGSCP
jgi:hypothetical protein